MLRTARLGLRRPRRDDVPAILAISSDPRTTHHNPGDRLRDLAGATELFELWDTHWETNGFGYFSVTLRAAPGDVIGFAGLKRMLVQGLPVLNLFYRLGPDHWGQGLATEAAAAVVELADRDHPKDRLIARIRPENLASHRVVAKVGLVAAGGIVGEDGYEDLFVRVRDQG